MILSDKGEIKISGRPHEVMADLAIIVYGLYQDRLLPKKDIEKAFELGLLSKNEINKKVKKIKDELLGGNKYDF